ncbi:hypothetical protein ACFYUD_15395 [Nocardia tengchongensis]|uniref:hypothetical protein n=1 Tax=Nocardia tengchongensis TaxID=2055889 RepID=UPI003680F0AC
MALTVAEPSVAFGGWRVRHCQHSLEVLMIAAGVVVLAVGLIWDWAGTDGGEVRQPTPWEQTPVRLRGYHPVPVDDRLIRQRGSQRRVVLE